MQKRLHQFAVVRKGHFYNFLDELILFLSKTDFRHILISYILLLRYDIRHLSEDRSSTREDLEGVEASTKVLQSLVDMESRELSNQKSRVMIGGFSQGGAIALNTLLKNKQTLGGCVALSTYVPGNITEI